MLVLAADLARFLTTGLSVGVDAPEDGAIETIGDGVRLCGIIGDGLGRIFTFAFSPYFIDIKKVSSRISEIYLRYIRVCMWEWGSIGK